MRDSADLEILKEAHRRSWMSQEQGSYCYQASLSQQRSPLTIALELGYLTEAQVTALRGPQHTPSTSASPSSHSPTVGALFDGYMIVRELGRGGMGAVYHGQKNGVDYALKVLLEETLDDERFQREAQALAKVDRHPHIVRIHGYQQCHGRRYIVFDYLPGGDLKGRLRESAYSENDALKLLIPITKALSHIHEHGFLHRDLKPENILFSDDRPLISDFGLAYSVSLETLTKTGSSLGTPAYMAPEQLDNQHSELCPATDTWALGIILYELITGEKPFKSSNAMQYAKAILTNDAPRIRALKPEVSEVTESIILKALEKDPAHRFQSAAEFEAACQGALDKALETLAIPSLQRRAKRRRRRGALVALIIAALIALFFAQDIDEALYQKRVSVELNEQTKLIDAQLDAAENKVPGALALLLLQAAGLNPDPELGKLALNENKALLKDFDSYVEALQAIPRVFTNSELEQRRARRSVLSHYWNSRRALSSKAPAPLDARLPNKWRRFFEAYQLFLEKKYKDSEKAFAQLNVEEDIELELKQLGALGEALSQSKSGHWRRAERSAENIAENAQPPWLGYLEFHIKEQEALESLFRPSKPAISDTQRFKNIERSWSVLLDSLAPFPSSFVDRAWESWNTKMQAGLKSGQNQRLFMLHLDFLARAWRKNPNFIRVKLDHPTLRNALRALFESGSKKKRKNNHGLIFNHFLSLRQLDRSFKMDLTFLIEKVANIANLTGPIETELDWLESVTRLGQGLQLDYQLKKERSKSLLAPILFQVSLTASRQEVFLPLEDSILEELDEFQLLDQAVHSNNDEVLPRFWRAQLNPSDFKKAVERSQKGDTKNRRTLAALYKRMDRDLRFLLKNKDRLSPRFLALVYRKSADWYSCVCLDLDHGELIPQDLGADSIDTFRNVSFERVQKALPLPHFRPDKALFDYARYLPGEQKTYFEAALKELDKRQARSKKSDYYVGRTLGEVILPVRDYNKEKARYSLTYARALKSSQLYEQAIQIAKESLSLEHSQERFQDVLASCYTATEDWSRLKALLTAMEQKERKKIVRRLNGEFKKKPRLSAELKKRFGQVE